MESTLQQLQQNTYPGRGILAGAAPDGRAVFAYFLTGRSENSRNRRLREDGASLRIEFADPSKVEDPSLVFYTPVRALADRLIVTNGDQTETIFETIQAGRSFRQALDTRRFEPDAPHYTPRISALLARDGIDLSIVRRAGCDGSCLRRYWHFAPVPGQGHLLHTYQQNGTPLPPFIGAPRPLAIPADPAALCRSLWDALPRDYRIALCVRYTDLATGQFTSCLKNLHGASSWINSN